MKLGFVISFNRGHMPFKDAFGGDPTSIRNSTEDIKVVKVKA